MSLYEEIKEGLEKAIKYEVENKLAPSKPTATFTYPSQPVKYIEQLPFVGDDGIYYPIEEYAPGGCMSNYKLIISKEMFVEAYNKWIRGEE